MDGGVNLRLVPPLTPAQAEAAAVHDLSEAKARVRRAVAERLREDPTIGQALREAERAIDECHGERDALVLLVSVLTDFAPVHQDPPPIPSTDQEVTRDATDSFGGPDQEPPPARPAR